ncbi:MAG: class I SAM-dependent methyltransferase [Chloroflexota bacterium]
MAHEFDKAAELGVPSLVWRAGQDRRLDQIYRAAGQTLHETSRALVNGCGVGMYNRALLEITPTVYGLDVEFDRVQQAAQYGKKVIIAKGETLPYPDDYFDLVLSNEVIEHVEDDARYAVDLVRVLKPGGRGIIFCPNRLWPFEVHGHYWKGQYHFGNTPLINYLPDVWRDKLAPHVRIYTTGKLQRLFEETPTRIISPTQVYPPLDNVIYRAPALGKIVRSVLFQLEKTPLRVFGISHLMVVEKI